MTRAPFYQPQKIRARNNSSFAYEDRKIQRVVQSARILPIHVKEGDIRGKSTSFYILVSGRPRSRELRDLVSFQLDKTGPRRVASRTPLRTCVHIVRDLVKKI